MIEHLTGRKLALNSNEKITFSSIAVDNYQKIDSYYITGNREQQDEFILLFKGLLFGHPYKTLKMILCDIISKGLEEFCKNEDGYFTGILYNSQKKEIMIFNDKLGYFDLYYYYSDTELIISSYFMEIVRLNNFTSFDIDKQSLFEFYLLDSPLFNKTFLKDVKLVPPGSIIYIDLQLSKVNIFQHFDYIFNINNDFTFSKVIKDLDQLFKKATMNIIDLFGKDTIFGLGLSGGIDSRMFAHYLSKEDINIVHFIFGDPQSDAYDISNKLAKQLKMNLVEVAIKNDFYMYAEECVDRDPMILSQLSWMYCIHDYLPQFEVLLTGYLGDFLCGSHLIKSDLHITNEEDFTQRVLNQYCENGYGPDFRSIFLESENYFSTLIRDIYKFARNSRNQEFWQKKEHFAMQNRERYFVKNNPGMSFFNKFPSFSLFIYPYVIDYILTIPPEFRLNRSLQYELLKHINYSLWKIRRERTILHKYNKSIIKPFIPYITGFIRRLNIGNLLKSHKSIKRIISNNPQFQTYIKKCFQDVPKEFYAMFNRKKVLSLVSKKKWSLIETTRLFRLLNIKFFMEALKI